MLYYVREWDSRIYLFKVFITVKCETARKRDLSVKVKVLSILWLILMVFFISESGQQTAEDWYNKSIALKALGQTPEANIAFAKAMELGYKG